MFHFFQPSQAYLMALRADGPPSEMPAVLARCNHREYETWHELRPKTLFEGCLEVNFSGRALSFRTAFLVRCGEFRLQLQG